MEEFLQNIEKILMDDKMLASDRIEVLKYMFERKRRAEKRKRKNLGERSEPPTRCCAVLATPKFRIEKMQRDNYLWIEKENGEATEISYDEFDKNFEKLFNNIM